MASITSYTFRTHLRQRPCRIRLKDVNDVLRRAASSAALENANVTIQEELRSLRPPIDTTPPVSIPKSRPLPIVDGSGSSSNVPIDSPVVLSSENGKGKEPQRNPDPDEEISDQEWEIRTGRAIYILQSTLPDFFKTGLISSLDTPVLPRKDSAPMSEVEYKSESIYSPRIRLEYTPPVPLPAPFPRTLSIEGLHLYIASSVFMRHTMNALYTDLDVEIRRVRVHGPRSFKASGLSSPTSGGSTPDDGGVGPGSGSDVKKVRSSREKSFFVGLVVTGAGRVSKAKTEWEVNCTYHFSPVTGQIQLHTVDSIEPPPTQSLFEALGRFGLLGGSSGNFKGAGGVR